VIRISDNKENYRHKKIPRKVPKEIFIVNYNKLWQDKDRLKDRKGGKKLLQAKESKRLQAISGCSNLMMNSLNNKKVGNRQRTKEQISIRRSEI